MFLQTQQAAASVAQQKLATDQQAALDQLQTTSGDIWDLWQQVPPLTFYKKGSSPAAHGLPSPTCPSGPLTLLDSL